ncbi:membrane fusion protein, multidrug efflux system [Prosthecobacter debontii]|uniref:Membrane fusion protein, multidrug efflux system n=2 Tax=Prosthecobacter debontii TaxID=48467 RepID=A0A1T4WIH5_9BACT|nr:membrane fusion protein, multidrug efflux system [Prosthecobacter debontii]
MIVSHCTLCRDLISRMNTILRSAPAGWLSAAVLCSSLLPACKPKDSGPPPAPPPTAVIVAKVTQQTVPIYVENVGQTEAAETVEIRARVDGFIIEAPFKEGSLVKKGDLLFKIDPRPYEAVVDQSKANVAKAEATQERARADLARLEPLVASSAISKQDRDTAATTVKVAEADLLAAKAALATAELNLGYATMVAPFDGMVGARQVDVGNYVSGSAQNALLATVSTTNPMRVSFNVAEQNYLRFQRRFMGDEEAKEQHSAQMEFELLLGDGSVYETKGHFEYADRALDPRTGTLKVVVSFANPEYLLRPGQFARVRAKTEEKPEALLVPQRAVSETQNLQMVLVVGEGNKVEQRPIKTDGRYQDQFVVTSGLKAGETVIVEGVQKARPGMQVNPQEEAEAPEAK